jgi:deoxycytidine triphosphate deaminase
MSILVDSEIKEAMKVGDIEITNFSPDNLEPASYDMRLGDKAIVSKAISLEEFKKSIKETEELDVKAKGHLIVPAGAFVLFTTLEKIRLSRRYAGHIGMRSYYSRKGLSILSGLQIDPGFSGVLVLGAVNLSPRSIEIPYAEPICTIEIHKLNVEASSAYSGPVLEAQREGRIPAADRDYLRTIETMSISDLTQALMTLSNNVSKLSEDVSGLKNYYIAGWITILAAIVALVLTKFLE